MGLMSILASVPTQVDTITSVILKKLDGTVIDGTSSSMVSIDDKVRVEYTWAISSALSQTLQAGDYTVVNLPSQLKIYNQISGNLYMDTDNTVVVGTYVITTAGVLTMTFNQNAVDYDDVAGTVWAQTWFDESLFGDDNPTEITFPINSSETTTITVKFAPKGVTNSVKKSGDTDRDYNARTITWTVDVNRKLESLTGVTVVDTLGEGQSLDETSVRLYHLTVSPTGDSSVGNEITYDPSNLTADASGFSLALGNIDTARRVVFTTTITDESKTQLTNQVAAGGSSASASVDTPRLDYVDKAGIADPVYNAKTIDWTVKANMGERTLAAPSMEDVIPAGLTYESATLQVHKLTVDASGNISVGDDVTASFNANYDSGTRKLTVSTVGPIDYAFVVTYTTTIVDKTQTSFTNTANLLDGPTTLSTDSATVQTPRGKPLTKTSNGIKNPSTYGYSTYYIQWQIDVNTEAETISAPLVDTVGSDLSLDAASIAVYELSISDTGNLTASSSPLTAGPATYTLTASSASGFTITFNDTSKAYRVIYNTIITNVDHTLSFSNAAEIGPNNVNETEDNTIAQISSKSAGTFNPANGSINTSAAVNYDAQTISWVTRIQPLKKIMKAVSVVDTYSTGQVLLPTSVKVYRGSTLLTDGNEYTLSHDETNRTFTVTFGSSYEVQGADYYIVYQTKFDYDIHDNQPINFPVINNQKKATNNATIKWDENPTGEDKSASVTIPPRAYNNGAKSGSLNRLGQYITWTIDVNHLSRSLNGVTVTDTVGQAGYQVIDPSSFVVKTYTVNASGNITLGAAIDLTGKLTTTDTTFSLALGDITEPYQITYRTNLVGLSQTTYTNKATVAGIDFPASVSYPDSATFLSKSGQQSADGLYVHWTIHVNKSLSDIQNLVLTDVLSDGHEVVSDSIEIYKATTPSVPFTNYTTNVYNRDLATGTQTFKIAFGETIFDEYVIEYDSKITTDVDNTVLTNQIFLDGDVGEELTDSGSGGVTVRVSEGGATGSGTLGTLKITKVDADDATHKIEGAVFNLYKQDGTYLGSGTTLADGTLTIPHLKKGTYILKEIEPPTGYQVGLAQREITVTLDPDALATVELTVPNYGFASLTIDKTASDTHEVLEGAVYELRTRDDPYAVVATLTTDATGAASATDLPFGIYNLVEVTAPDGFYKNATQTVTLDENLADLTLSLDLEDDRILGEIKITKEDSEIPTLKLEGAVFEVYRVNVPGPDLKVGTITTDEHGEASLGDLPVGNYYAIEVTPPDGYYINQSKWTFAVSEGNIEHEFTVTDNIIKGSVIIHKVDSGDASVKLEGAVFEVRAGAADGPVAATLTSNAAGTASALLRPGIYYLVETQAPAGYFPLGYTKLVLVQPYGQAEYDIPNDIVGSLDIKKVDSRDNTTAVAGAVFTLSNATGVVATLTTDLSGEASADNLRPGAYTLTETTAPTGFAFVSPVTFTVSAVKAHFEYTIPDAPTDVTISKTSLVDGEVLDGAHLALYLGTDTSGTPLYSWVTDDVNNPKQIVGELIAGQTYTLVETQAPDGYVVAEQVTFTVATDGTPQKVEMKDKPTDVSFSKRGIIGSAEIPGATLTVYDGATVVETWTSTATPHRIVAKLVAGKTYTLTEDAPPSGYAYSASVPFTVRTDGTPQTVVMRDVKTLLSITKLTDLGLPLIGASLEIRDAGNNVIDSWVSGVLPHPMSGVLNAGETYTLVETAAPRGYAVADPVEFTVSRAAGLQSIVMTDKPTDVYISKTTVTGTDELFGAHLVLKDSSGNTVDQWYSGIVRHRIYAQLVAGATYTLTETSAPAGYTVAEAISFTVNSDGTPQTVVMKDKPTDVSFSKVGITQGEELAGAELVLKNRYGITIDVWTSGATPHRIVARLVAGEEYTLTEVSAPDGYVMTESITFTVGTDGVPQTVTMTDKPTDVTFSKTGIAEGEELPGATLTIYDAQNNVVETWVSTDTAHRIVAKLLAGATYTLVEETAPDGYVVAESIEFTVGTDGVPQTVAMEDKPTDVTFSKTGIAEGEELPGATLTIYDAANNEVESWVSTDTAHQIVAKLLAGATYTLVEETAPDGYVIAESIEFTVGTDGVPQTVTMEDKPTDVTFSKTSTTGTDELVGAKLKIVDPATHHTVESWTSTDTAHQIVAELIAGKTYILVEETAPNGYVVAESIEFTVGTDGVPQTVTMKDKPTDVTIYKRALSLSGLGEIQTGAVLKITDFQGNEVIAPWTSDGTAHEIVAQLTAGKWYWLVEVTPPAGYVVSAPVLFRVRTDGRPQDVTMIDLPTTVVFSKTAITGGPELPGATLTIYDAENNVVETWVSGSLPHIVSGKLVAGATYTLVEETAPDGYVIAESIAFTVPTNAIPKLVQMKDKPTDVTFSKTTVTGTDELPGATLTIYDAENNVVETWVSTDTAHRIVAKLLAGETYTLVEETAPDGYVVAESIEFTVGTDGVPQMVTMKDAPTDVTFSKTTVTGTDELPGATLTIYDAENNVVETWVSTDTAHRIVAKLLAGETYTLVEETAPDGYTVAESIELTVGTDGVPQMVTMKDAPTDVTFSKTTVTGTDELPGATLTIYDAQNNVVETWVSTDTAHRIVAKLLAGETYTLVEETAPDGYTVAEPIEFTVGTDGVPQTVTMKDAPTDVTFSKTTVTGTDELPGATLTIYDAENNVVETWVSTDTAHRIVAKLLAGETYTLVEETAPDGYVVAESIEFTVGTDGVPQTVTMKDAPTDVTFSKTTVTGTDELPGATLTIYDSADNVVETWVSTDTAHQIVAKLIAGATYTLVEETSPDGYAVAESIEFTVGTDGLPQTITMKDAPTDVTFSKTTVTGTDELPGATLTIYDSANNVVETWVSTDTAHQIVAKLIAGATYTLVEETSPDGYAVAESIEFTVGTDGLPQTITMKDAPTDVTFSKTTVTGGPELPGATLTIYDAENNVVETWVSTDTAHQIVAKLIAGATYTLVEETSPDGYAVAESIEFTVGTDGVPQLIEMIDGPTTVTISKRAVGSSRELKGARLAVYDPDGNLVKEWVTTGEPMVLEGLLNVGTIYTLKELDAPDGYAVASPITFEVHRDGSSKRVIMRDARLTEEELPKTGDANQLGLWLGIMLSSFAMLIGVVAYARKRVHER